MKSFRKKAYKIPKSSWAPICLILLIILFFSIRLVITYDSAHYLNYVAIFEGNSPISNWDIVRGPIFPTLIFLFDTLFGKTGSGILVGTFIFYLIFSITCYKICEELCQNYKHKNLVQNILLIILILNPLIMGYFHVLLTEFVAITFTVLNILLAYKWLSCDLHNKKQLFLYSLYFIFSIIFCYHLKQPYIIISFIPPFTAAIIAIIKNHTWRNILYRISTLLLSIILLFISISLWDNFLKNKGVNMNTGRDSSSLLSHQLLQAYQITYDQDNDGATDPLSTIDAIGIIFNDFISNPSRITSIYISNYCGLTSICTITSDDGVNYVATFNFAGLDTFENTAIGYRPYSTFSNLFVMPDDLYENAILYGESSNRSFFAFTMNILKTPTNLLFKFSSALCFPTLIFLVILRIKFKNRSCSTLFYLSLILLITSFSHLAFSAGVGLIIDRYAIESFIPSMLGIFGTITYYKNIIVQRKLSPKNKKTKEIKS